MKGFFRQLTWIHRTMIWVGIALIVLILLAMSIRGTSPTTVEIDPSRVLPANSTMVVAAGGGEGKLIIELTGEGVYDAYEYLLEEVDSTRFILNISMMQPIIIEANTDVFSGTTIIAAAFHGDVKQLLDSMSGEKKHIGKIKLEGGGQWTYSRQLALNKLLVLYIKVFNETIANAYAVFYPLAIGITSPEATIAIGIVLVVTPLIHVIAFKRTVNHKG